VSWGARTSAATPVASAHRFGRCPACGILEVNSVPGQWNRRLGFGGAAPAIRVALCPGWRHGCGSNLVLAGRLPGLVVQHARHGCSLLLRRVLCERIAVGEVPSRSRGALSRGFQSGQSRADAELGEKTAGRVASAPIPAIDCVSVRRISLGLAGLRLSAFEYRCQLADFGLDLLGGHVL